MSVSPRARRIAGRACARAARAPIGRRHMVWCQTTGTVQFNNKMLVGLGACQSCVWSHDGLVALSGSESYSRPSVRRASASHTRSREEARPAVIQKTQKTGRDARVYILNKVSSSSSSLSLSALRDSIHFSSGLYVYTGGTRVRWVRTIDIGGDVDVIAFRG